MILVTGFSEERSLTETLRTTMLAYNEVLVRTRTEVTRREESTMLREQQDREYRESAEAGDKLSSPSPVFYQSSPFPSPVIDRIYFCNNKTVVAMNCLSMQVKNPFNPNLTLV